MPIANQLQHLLIDHVVDRDIDLGVTHTKILEDRRQQITRERRDGRQGHASTLQGKALTYLVLGVVPFSDQAPGQGQQRFTFGGQGHIARGAAEQAPAQTLLQGLDGQAQGRLRQMQALAGHRKTQALGHGKKGTDLFYGHGSASR